MQDRPLLVPKPLIVINFKTYAEATGANADRLARLCQKVSTSTGAPIWVAVQAFDVLRLAKRVRIPVLGQHIDNVQAGAFTGHLLPEALREAGGRGSLLNHAERQIPLDAITALVARLRALRLTSIVCANSPEAARRIVACKPDYLALEPPDLIGGNISVSSARPEDIQTAFGVVKGTGVKLLVGAGVKTHEDVRIALKLGAKGVLLASGVTMAGNPEAALRNLAQG